MPPFSRQNKGKAKELIRLAINVCQTIYFNLLQRNNKKILKQQKTGFFSRVFCKVNLEKKNK
jgi:hypothetical protein